MSRMPNAVLLAMVLPAVAFSAAPALGAEQPSESQIRNRLAGLSLAQNDVTGMQVIPRMQARSDGERLLGYDAWIKLASCSQGNLVLYMSPQCTARGAYTTGSCAVAGVGD